jgi:hypothetical protein
MALRGVTYATTNGDGACAICSSATHAPTFARLLWHAGTINATQQAGRLSGCSGSVGRRVRHGLSYNQQQEATTMIQHLKERIEYNADEAAWLAKGAPEGQEPWREWDYDEGRGWEPCRSPMRGLSENKYRRRPKMLSCVDAKGVEHKFPEPMREAPELYSRYWTVDIANNRLDFAQWDNWDIDRARLAAGLCQATEEGAIDQLKALRVVCGGGE